MSSKSIENTEQVRELERAILGGLMLETERYDAVSEIIAVSYTHLTLPTNREV